MTKQEIQAFLKEQKSYLANYQTIDIRGIKRYASEIISRVANAFDLNPRVLLVMLQKEQSLIKNKKVTKDQLDWAMGYSICDSCSKRDPRLKKYKGFAKQVFYAAERISESYLVDLKKKGFTIAGIGPGKTTTIGSWLCRKMRQRPCCTRTPRISKETKILSVFGANGSCRIIQTDLFCKIRRTAASGLFKTV